MFVSGVSFYAIALMLISERRYLSIINIDYHAIILCFNIKLQANRSFSIQSMSAIFIKASFMFETELTRTDVSGMSEVPKSCRIHLQVNKIILTKS